MRPAPRAVVLGALLPAALAAACSRAADERPRWIALAEGFAPRASLDAPEVRAVWEAGEQPLLLSSVGTDARVWIETRIEPEEWRPTIWPRVWRAERPLAGFSLRLGDAEPPRFEMGGRDFEHLDLPDVDLFAEAPPEPGRFVLVQGNVCVSTEAGEPPGAARLAVPIERGRAAGGRWRLTVDHLTADGLPVWPGQAEELVLDLPPGSALSFSAVARELLPDEEARVGFRVLLDGAELWAAEQRLAPRVREVHARVDLPPEGRRGARLRFEVEGAPAIAAFLAPTVHPRETGVYGARPWAAAERPSVVLFVADTFRADNMALYGGELGLTPHLDRLAEESVRFLRAWSPSTWTLPAHASLFTGLYPHEHGAVHIDLALGEEARTLAEWLRDAGYRTASVNEGGFLSHTFGVDQGFDWYDELPGELPGTAARALELVERDDGRPLFLFVQTYRAHDPYRASEEARRALLGAVEFGEEWEVLDLAVDANPWGWERGAPLPDELAGLVAEMRALYLGGVVDLDREVGTFLAALEETELAGRCVLVFTSDHGEAFGEHDEIHHGTGVFEEHVRVPLLVRAPGLAPRTVEHAAGLVDLPHTLAELLDLAPEPGWRGRSLLSLDEDRPVFAFQCSMHPGPSYAAVIEGPRKLLVREDAQALRAGEPWRAFDLGRDRAEREDRSAEAWARELGRRLGPRAAELLAPAVAPGAARLDATARKRLQELGYAGE